MLLLYALMHGTYSPAHDIIAECLAVQEGIKLITRRGGFRNWVIETDAINLVNAILFQFRVLQKRRILDDIRVADHVWICEIDIHFDALQSSQN
ncbi:hypothetical protein L484_015028 [Morus notabilis]|uniref:Uncharacterized protein n=1 Tax=Morus notabilis TaxID=981085 RepID=W9SHM3_9ROSA|nr:hypothetical protein L484_015028 [Morus notabilis]